MIAIRVRKLITLWFVACSFSACDRNQSTSESLERTYDRCSGLAKKQAIDEKCAIEIAKTEIVKRQGKMIYSTFSGRFAAEEKLWIVTGIYDPPTPGGHVIVFVQSDGNIHRYEIGE